MSTSRPQHPTLKHRDTLTERVQIPSTTSPTNGRKKFTFNKAKTRLEAYQRRWMRIDQLLPPQINRRHISVISIGGVIGMGLFLSTGTALRHAGPAGTVLGYAITGSVVWAVVISIGEMVSFLPNVGGTVGLAGLYVDPALGFALGWNAWYNWTIILPTELSAAAVLINGFFSGVPQNLKAINLGSISVLLVIAIAINTFGASVYGETEFIFSCIKLLTIIFLILFGIALDAGAGATGRIGFSNWHSPGPFLEYRAKGGLGKFLGVWSSMNQAAFAFFGTEVPSVAAGEVQNPTRNIPRAVHRVWIRITLFYVLAVFVAGLLVKSDDKRLMGGSSSSGNPGKDLVSLSPFVIALQDSKIKHLDKIINAAFVISAFSAATSDVYISSRYLFFLAHCGHAPRFCAGTYENKANKTFIPWVGILFASLFALLAFMSASNAEEAFHWLSSMNTTTALLSWVGMLFTYLRWYQGTRYAESRDADFKKRNWEHLYRNRNRFQPFIAIYAFIMCTLILVFNGWFVFTRPGPWRIARDPLDKPIAEDPDIGDWVPTFVSSYLPLPLFVLLALGYKLIYRTQMTRVEDMNFARGEVPSIEEYRPTTRWGKILAALF